MTTLESSLPVVSGRLSLPYATAIALFIEVLLLAALVIGLSDAKKTMPPRPQPVMLSFPVIQTAPPKPTPTPPRKPLVKPVPHLRPAPVHHIAHHPSPPVHKTELAEPPPAPLAMAPAAPDTVSAPPQSTPVKHTEKPSPPNVDPNIKARFEDQVRSAVQSAMHYPYAARMAHISGRTQISFEYTDGQVSAVKIAVSSGYGMLDSAALQAVSAAAYPAPPKTMVGKSMPFKVWVRFYLTGPSAN